MAKRKASVHLAFRTTCKVTDRLIRGSSHDIAISSVRSGEARAPEALGAYLRARGDGPPWASADRIPAFQRLNFSRPVYSCSPIGAGMTSLPATRNPPDAGAP
ncbi:hypothetical protein GCM10011322_08820 [Salinarimonas ramus]|uniref:Uncharacterized protein n=1 Tax=Salinarimonas ramus TaxID=690164 RepID=A0A917Q5K6_9HYPH|nr:hypothetical protein GCM10011322_08820 [Salinarimonas ramus]